MSTLLMSGIGFSTITETLEEAQVCYSESKGLWEVTLHGLTFSTFLLF